MRGAIAEALGPQKSKLAPMRLDNQQLESQQRETIGTLRAIAVHLARDSANGLTEDSRRVMRELADWLEDRANRQSIQYGGPSKAALTRTRLFCLQLERLLDQLEHSEDPSREPDLCDEIGELVGAHQKRYLYEDMLSCFRELSAIAIERGQGRQAVIFNDMATRLETRLECGHINLDDEEQRAKDEALYAEFREKLEDLRS